MLQRISFSRHPARTRLRGSLLAGLALAAAIATAAAAGAQTRYLAFGSSITEGIFWDDCECEAGVPPVGAAVALRSLTTPASGRLTFITRVCGR